MKYIPITMLLITLVGCGSIEREDQALMCIGACSLYESKTKNVDQTEEIDYETETKAVTD